MPIKTQELKDAIKAALVGTSTKDLVVQMAHIVFNSHEILSYNDRVSISIPFESGIKCSVPAEDLNKVLSGISDKELTMVVDENSVAITSESTEASISTEVESRAVETYFDNLEFDAMEWEDLPKNFMSQLSLARLSASSNVYDANNLACVHIKGKSISSGDGHKLSMLTLSSKMKEVLIPSSSVNDIIVFSDFDEYAISDGWIHFSNESSTVLSCRIVIGNFPDLSQFFDNFEEVAEIKIDSNLIPILQNLGGLVAGQSDFMKSVQIQIGKGETIISGKKEGLQIKKKVVNKHTEDAIDFSISPDFLAHILTMTNTLSIGEATAMFASKTFKHLVQLPIMN